MGLSTFIRKLFFFLFNDEKSSNCTEKMFTKTINGKSRYMARPSYAFVAVETVQLAIC